MGVCGSGLCIIMPCGSGRREKLLEIAFQERKPGGVQGEYVCLCDHGGRSTDLVPQAPGKEV